MGYQREALKGFSWMGLLRGSTRAIAFLKLAILARILTPVEFGIFGIASITLAVLEILTETGINVFLVQNKKDIKEYIDSAWVISILRGIVISLLLFVLAMPVAKFFGSVEATHILILIAIVPLVRGFINPSIVAFQRNLEFNKEFFLRFFVFLFDAGVAIIVALITKSATSFVWGMLAGVSVEIVLSFVFISPKPKFSFEWRKMKEVIGRGKWVTLAGFFNYLFHQGDDIFVGKVLGNTSLGMYQMAYKLSTFPIIEVGEVFNKVSFPIYSKISSDKKRLKKAFLKITGGIVLLTIPFGLTLYLFTYKVVNIVFGLNWISIVPVVKILAIFGIIRSISGSFSALFFSVDKQEYVTWMTLLSIVGMGIVIFPFVRMYGIAGAGASALFGSVVALPLVIYFVNKTLKDK